MLPRFLDEIVPSDPDLDRSLADRLARDARRRIDRALRAARSVATGRRAERLRRVRRSLEGARGAFFADGRVRTWIAEIEDAVAVAREANAVLSGVRRSPSRLVELVLVMGALAEAAPSGALPAGFPRRALRIALRELDTALMSAPRDDPRRETGIVVTRVLKASGRRVVQGGRDRGFEGRVPKALAILGRVWPEASRLVLGRTHRVVPVAERDVVSFSSASEPGVSYIHVRSSPLVRLAEDLLHEATHQRIHEIESVCPLAAVGDGPDDPRIYSPWRRVERPVRGLVHGSCTFVVGAGYFRRLLERSRDLRLSPTRRAWVRRRLHEEIANVRDVLTALRGARRRGLVTASGERLLRTVARDLRRLA